MRRLLFVLLLSSPLVACSGSSGAGINLGCGPGDPCCAAGDWVYTCPPSSQSCDCGSGFDGDTFQINISPIVAFNGGPVQVQLTDGGVGPTLGEFTPSTCSFSEPTCAGTIDNYFFSSSGATADSNIYCVDSTTRACTQCFTLQCTAVRNPYTGVH